MSNPQDKYKDYSKEELIEELETLKKKKYGLVWDKKNSQEILDAFVNWENMPEKLAPKTFPILKEIKDKKIQTDKNEASNLLIEGDNYHSLAVLNFTHKKSVDIIYIDPPYNTGNKDFIYNDQFIDREDPWRHSKWLSFMEKRLVLAKNLLKDNGLFFVSIDDNEVAQLKLLCDEIFGEKNFKNSIIVSRVKKNIQEREFAKSLNVGHGIILFYAMPKAEIVIPTKYQEKGERWHAFDAPGIRNTMEYELFGFKPPKGRHWMFEEQKAKALIEKGLLRPNPRTGKPQYKLEASDTTRLDTDWTDLQEGDSSWGFENGEKNTELIKRLIKMHPAGNCVIADFFAGSGTTGHSILDLNKEGYKHKFILATNNENNICTDVCYPRLKKAISGYKDRRGNDVGGLGGNLKYFKTDFIASQPTDKNKRDLVNNSADMLRIKEGIFDLALKENIDFHIYQSGDRYLGIVFNEEKVENFIAEANKLDGRFSIYCFSYSEVPPTKEFEAMKNKYSLQPIPEIILKVYREIFKK